MMARIILAATALAGLCFFLVLLFRDLGRL